MSSNPDGAQSQVNMVVSTELGNSGALEKVETSTQLDERQVGVNVGGGIDPPYDPSVLAAFQEINGTHSRAIAIKSKWEVGFGFDIVPHPRVDDPDESQKKRVGEFWHGRDSRWKIGPEGTAAATPDEVLAMARRDWHGQGWLSLEILTDGAGDPVGLAHVPSTTTRVRKSTASDGSETLAGTGYVQTRGGESRYFGEAGARHADGDGRAFVSAETGRVYQSGRAVPGDVANEMLLVVNPSPLSLYYGIPDWVAEMQTMVAEQAAKDYNRDLFEHKAIPYLAVIVKNGQLSEASRQQLREIIHGLKGESHRTVILEAEKIVNNASNDLLNEDGSDPEIELQPLGLTENEDMAFSEFREFNERDIGKVHGVPPQLLGRMGDSNRSNIKESIRTFANQEIAPEQSRFAERLYRTLHVDYLDAPDWTIEFELRGADTRERDAQIAATKLKAAPGVVKVNEARRWFGLDELDGMMGDMMVSEVGGAGGGVADAMQDELDQRTDDIESNLSDQFVNEQLMQQGADAD